MINRKAAQAYAQIGLETSVAAASPERLVVLLYDGAIGAIGEASAHLAARSIAGKGAAISRAVAIIDQGLRASIDMARGGKIAEQLASLYGYMCRRLLTANIANEQAGFDEVVALLKELREAWMAIDSRSAARPQTAVEAAFA